MIPMFLDPGVPLELCLKLNTALKNIKGHLFLSIPTTQPQYLKYIFIYIEYISIYSKQLFPNTKITQKHINL